MLSLDGKGAPFLSLFTRGEVLIAPSEAESTPWEAAQLRRQRMFSKEDVQGVPQTFDHTIKDESSIFSGGGGVLYSLKFFKEQHEAKSVL